MAFHVRDRDAVTDAFAPSVTGLGAAVSVTTGVVSVISTVTLAGEPASSSCGKAPSLKVTVSLSVSASLVVTREPVPVFWLAGTVMDVSAV